MAQIQVRCSKEITELFDQVCDIYGMTRAELLRAGAISYCKELLALSTLQHIASIGEEIDNSQPFDNKKLMQLEELKEQIFLLGEKTGIPMDGIKPGSKL